MLKKEGMASLFHKISHSIGDFLNGRGRTDDFDDPGIHQVHDLKARLLQEVRDAAGTERPSLEQYREACHAFAQTDEGKAMVAEGKWSDRIAADLSHQNLDGFAITEPKKAVRAAKTHDLHDRDGNGQIDVESTHEFYDHVRFDHASLNHAFIEPATSYNDQIAKADHLDGLHFHGMENGDHFTFRSGHYTNPVMSEINGGSVTFAQGSSVDGLKLSGKSAEIHAHGNARISHLEITDQFRVVKLHLAKGSSLSDSNLEGATISMASEVAGSQWSRVKLGANVDGLNLSGAKLHDVSIEGEPITNAAQLKAHGVTVDAHTQISASPDFLREHQHLRVLDQTDQVIKKLSEALKMNGLPQQPAAAEASPESKMTLAIDFENKAERIIKAAVELNPSGTRAGDKGMIAGVRLAAQEFTNKYADIIKDPDHNAASNGAILNMPKPKELIRESGMPLPPLPHRVNG